MVRELGQGGMATVFLAEDLRHDRKVALKVLKPELAAVLGADRFVQEIKTTAGLQHPHILPLFDSGRAAGRQGGAEFLYYVMPYVEGETLRAKLDRERQLGLNEAVQIATDVASALHYAHQHGVIHRDIKPENILLHDGRPMVADFGIALAVSAAAGGRMTETGLSLGTPHYMSPEQATAEKELTGRSDVYSLGSVLYEMLTGDPPHTGASAQQIIMKIVTDEARPVEELRRSVPPHVAAAVAQALEKLPADRFESARAFAEALNNPTFTRAGARPVPVGPAPARQTSRLFGAVLVAAVALALWGWLRPAAVPQVQRLHLDLPEGRRFRIWPSRADPIDISPDGRRLVYQEEVGVSSRLVVRELDSFDSRELPGTEGARHHFFSPDGEWVAFFAGGVLQRVSVHGGAASRIAEARGTSFGGSWGEDGKILYVLNDTLYLVGRAGEAPRPIRLPDSVAVGDTGRRAVNRLRWPHLLPGGTEALVTAGQGIVVAVNLGTAAVKYVLAGEQAQYLPTRHLVFDAGQERIRAVPFDLGRLEVTGAEIPVVDDVFRGPGSGAATFAVAAQAGTLIYAQGSVDRELVLVDRNGRVTATPAERRGYRFPRVSPDGRFVAVTVDPRPSDVWVVDLVDGRAVRQQTPQHDGWAVWSPDGKKIAFVGGRGGAGWRAWPFADDAVPIPQRAVEPTYFAAWTSDDRLVAATGADIVAVSVNDGAVSPVVATEATEADPALSPDRRWLAYVSDVSGADEVYVQGYPAPGERRVVSVGGGVDPAWSHDGTELYYRRGDTILTVPVRAGARFEVLGAPRPLFSGPFDFTQSDNWDATPDGRFLMVRTNAPTTTRLMVVLNWFEELQARAPR